MPTPNTPQTGPSEIPDGTFLEYYQLAFADFLLKRGSQGGNLRSPCAKRTSFWQIIPPGLYSPAKGREYAEAYIRSLETELRSRIERNSIVYWLHIFRRLAPLSVGTSTSPATANFTRASLEAAIQKWGTGSPCARIGNSAEVPPSAILRGYLVNHNQEYMFESLRTQSQLVLTDFGLPEFCDAIEVEKLAYEVWLAMAMLRSLGKGAELVVSPEIGGVGTRKSDELQFLVDHYDARQTAMHTTATGTTFEDTVQGKNNGLVPLPQYNVQQTPFASFDPIFRRLGCSLEGPPGQVSTTNFIWIPFDLRAYYHAHKPFSAAFKEKHGVSLESVVAIIGTILRNAAFEMVTDYPRRFIRLWQRAYQPPCPIENYRQRIYNGLPTVLSHLELPLRPEEVDVDGAMAFLTLTDARRGDIDIGYGGPHCIFLPAGEGKIIIDYAYIYLRLYYLFHRVSIPDQNFKGDALENVTRRGGSVLPTRALKAPDGTERQIDAAFAIEDTLVICECRAVAKSIAVFRGEPQALEKRIRVIETALSDVDEKAHWLASHPQGSNYDVTQYRLIMPVAVTPFLEFIPSRSSRYWIDERLPRVLTPAELQEALTDGSIRTAAPHCPNSVRLR